MFYSFPPHHSLGMVDGTKYVVNGMQIFPYITVNEFLYQGQKYIGRWSTMGKIWSTWLKNDPIRPRIGGSPSDASCHH